MAPDLPSVEPGAPDLSSVAELAVLDVSTAVAPAACPAVTSVGAVSPGAVPSVDAVAAECGTGRQTRRAAGWPEEATVVSAREGDVESIAALIRASHPHVRRFANALCATPQDAEDAAQEALIILFRKIGMLRATGALASWLFRIVRHECMRLFRPKTSPVDAVVDEGTPALSAEEEVLARLDAAEVARAIAALPAGMRDVLVLRDVRGLSGAATAETLGLSLPAMKSRLHRARTALHGSLGPLEEHHGRS